MNSPRQQSSGPSLVTPEVSVVICTHNRCQLLAKTIRSLQRQDVEADRYEIIVADNASTDGTRALVHELGLNSDVCLRYVYECRLGVSHARNAGLSSARGIFIAYIDDDEEACAGWIRSIIEAFRYVNPQPGIVFGPVNPAWECRPPDWLDDELGQYLSIVQLGSDSKFVTNLGWFPEGNSAFRTDVLREIGGFATDCGRKGTQLLGGENARVQERIKERGCQIYYHRSMAVDHFIPAARMTVDWLSKRAYYQGISDVNLHFGGRSYGLLSYLRWNCLYCGRALLRSLLTFGMRLLSWAPFLGRRTRVSWYCKRIETARKVGWSHGFIVHPFVASKP